MGKICTVCGEPAHQSLGGVLLCTMHASIVRDQVDSIRAAGGQVDVARIAYGMREPETSTRYAPSDRAVRAFLQSHQITGGNAARMMYLSGSRQVRKYTGGDKPRQMDGARWFCLHAHVILSPDQIREIEAAMEAAL